MPFGQAVDEFFGFGASMDEARQRAEELRAQMSPLELAQLNLNEAVRRFGADSPQAIAAVGEYEHASAEAKREQEQLDLAVRGVTQSMIDQADQALAAIDSSFAYRNATGSSGSSAPTRYSRTP